MNLTPRQRDVLTVLARTGESDKLIARELGIGSTTVKVHMRELCGRLRVKNRTQAALWAIRNQIAA